jgi:fluoroacetyl-CoA thioesterase
MPSLDLQPGLIFRQAILVDESLTVPHVAKSFAGFADMPPVFATAFMVGFVEWTCVEALRPYLLKGEHTVGTLIDVSHIAATPIGMRVTAEVRLLAVVGRKLRFCIMCHDELELIGKGCHERTVIHTASFTSRSEQKRSGIGFGHLESAWHDAAPSSSRLAPVRAANSQGE